MNSPKVVPLAVLELIHLSAVFWQRSIFSIKYVD